jgi:hypothetical protein
MNRSAMPFRFKKSETAQKAVRRVGAERVRVALKGLEKAHRPTSIHNVRKEIKKLRALLRLVRGELGRDGYRKAVKPYFINPCEKIGDAKHAGSLTEILCSRWSNP